MNLKHCRLAATVALMCLAAPGLAQVSTDNPASTATGKGTAADGTRPADGAIKGGAIVPGETGGVPTDRAASRCGDLTGTLREECLAQERNVSALLCEALDDRCTDARAAASDDDTLVAQGRIDGVRHGLAH